MNNITLAQFYMGRDTKYASELTQEIENNAAVTVERANLLLDAFYAAKPDAADRHVNSGWRPPEVNATTNKAAVNSKHMTGRAVDLSDDDGALDAWCLSPEGQVTMENIELWMESPRATPRWTHLQIVAPGSGKRVFLP